jgi:hypothetical protein
MRLALSLSIVVCVACSKATPTAPPVASQTAPTAAAAASPGAPALAKTLDPATDLSALADRMQFEASHRPGGKVNADTVLDALERTGMHLRKRRQYLGATMHASYCAGGTTSDGVAISVCEYTNHEAAMSAKQFIDKQYAAIDASRVVQGQTLLVVARAQPQVAELAIHTFNTL